VERHIYQKLSFVVAFLCIVYFAKAQDIHYSNFGFSPININPALTGVFPGDYRLNASYRNQWQGVPVSYSTFSVAADMRLGSSEKSLLERRWSLGLLFNNDKAGWSHLSNSNVNLSGSYIKPLSQNDFLTAGASLGFFQRRFGTGDLTWDDQYQNKQFNPNLVSADVAIFDRSVSFADLSTGLNYHHQKPNTRNAFDLGLGIYNLNRPATSFKNDPLHKLPVRYSAYAGANIKVTQLFDVLVEGIGQWQGPHRELVGSIGGRLYLVDNMTKQIALQAGITYRGKDAFSPHFGLIYNRWKAAVNFDSNFSSFKTASNRLGGPEISVIYIFSKVPPGNYCPICPTYL
jgi:type IX secretion system PorP/SprF family membrane protein